MRRAIISIADFAITQTFLLVHMSLQMSRLIGRLLLQNLVKLNAALTLIDSSNASPA
jgi:hypothetical protein